MSRTLPRLFATAALAAALPFAAHAQEKDTQGGTPTDAGFYKNASAAGIAEVELSKLAQTKASSQAVKKFADTMVTDHQKANDELEGLRSGDKGYSLAHEPAPDSQKDIDALEHLSGSAFDREYMKIMVQDHEKAVAIFEAEAEKGSSEQLKNFATKTLPTLKHHLEMARSLNRGK